MYSSAHVSRTRIGYFAFFSSLKGRGMLELRMSHETRKQLKLHSLGCFRPIHNLTHHVPSRKISFEHRLPCSPHICEDCFGGSAILTAHPGRSADHGDLYKGYPAASRLLQISHLRNRPPCIHPINLLSVSHMLLGKGRISGRPTYADGCLNGEEFRSVQNLFPYPRPTLCL